MNCTSLEAVWGSVWKIRALTLLGLRLSACSLDVARCYTGVNGQSNTTCP